MFRDTPLFVFRGPWGIPVQIGATILLLPLILIDPSGTTRDLAFDVMFVAIILGSIFLHELGHAWGALVQGVPVERILLHGGGGFCQQTRAASRHETELIVAMGPIINLALWALAGLTWPHIGDPEVRWVFQTVAWVNGFLFVLNLVPVHPLDGGKLFQLALMRVLPADAATAISGRVGLILSIVWMPVMVMFYLATGVALFFIPSVRLHWEMLRQRRA